MNGEFKMNPDDVWIKTMRKGSMVNEPDTVVMATHIPTGCSVTSFEHKSQRQNRKAALSALRKMVKEYRESLK